ncbi:O-antigen translocase [Rhodopirellula sp. SWK7]|uniref:O-antigen translocase n=1 Tax=Rhodopirellula sp. SWK7 TaxID=595460 RepID=UPI001360B101|nr:O-antigen translocase [Rhodopirellula sp. SWK7]
METSPSRDTAQAENKDEQRSYASILRSSSIVGGAQVINMAIGLVRTKLVAVLIGPAGIGLVGIYLSITAMANTLAGMGIQTSGVRDVAKHHGDQNAAGIAATVITLRRVCWLTGIAGALLLAIAAPWISQLSFGSGEYTLSIALLGFTIFFNNLAGGQTAILQGTRRIGDLARKQILGAILGTIVSVVLYAWLGMNGIVPALIALSVMTLAVSTYYSRKIPLAKVSMNWKQSLMDAGGLLKFGASMVVAGLVGAGATYAIRAVISNELDLQAVGIYTAAFTLSGMFVQFVLQAMGADFYPRLTAESDDHAAMRRMINEQTEVGLLLAFPGLLATLALAPWVIRLFYTAEFAPAAEMLKWFVVGCMGKVLSFPLGYALLAKGQGKTFVVTESIFHLFHFLTVLVLIQPLGLLGAAMAFAALYILCCIVLLLLTRFTIKFRWSPSVLAQLFWMTPLAVFVLSIDLAFNDLVSGLLGSATALVAGLVCTQQLSIRLEKNHRVNRAIRSLPGAKLILPHL